MKNCQLKVCGIRNVEEAVFCEKLGVDLIGLNFVTGSKRRVDVEMAQKISSAAGDIVKVGIFQNQTIEEVNRIAKDVGLDMIQLSGNEDVSFAEKCCKPVIKGISVNGKDCIERAETFSKNVAWIIFDGPSPGSGKSFNWDLVSDYRGKFFVAGGMNEGNISEVILMTQPDGIDLASGVETDGKIDLEKIEKIYRKVNVLQ